MYNLNYVVNICISPLILVSSNCCWTLIIVLYTATNKCPIILSFCLNLLKITQKQFLYCWNWRALFSDIFPRMHALEKNSELLRLIPDNWIKKLFFHKMSSARVNQFLEIYPNITFTFRWNLYMIKKYILRSCQK